EEVLAESHTEERRAALEHVAGLISALQFEALISELRIDPERLGRAARLGPDVLAAAQRRVLDATAAREEDILAAAVSWPEEPALRSAAHEVAFLSTACTIVER